MKLILSSLYKHPSWRTCGRLTKWSYIFYGGQDSLACDWIDICKWWRKIIQHQLQSLAGCPKILSRTSYLFDQVKTKICIEYSHNYPSSIWKGKRAGLSLQNELLCFPILHLFDIFNRSLYRIEYFLYRFNIWNEYFAFYQPFFSWPFCFI